MEIPCWWSTPSKPLLLRDQSQFSQLLSFRLFKKFSALASRSLPSLFSFSKACNTANSLVYLYFSVFLKYRLQGTGLTLWSDSQGVLEFWKLRVGRLPDIFVSLCGYLAQGCTWLQEFEVIPIWMYRVPFKMAEVLRLGVPERGLVSPHSFCILLLAGKRNSESYHRRVHHSKCIDHCQRSAESV